MSDVETVDSAVEEPIEDNNAESVEDSQGLTEEQVEKLLQDRDKKWQSKFDKLLQEKKDTETKSKTAEERIAEIERKYEQERINGVRERALNSAKLDPTVVEVAQSLLSNDEEAVSSGAERFAELIDSLADKRAKDQVAAEIAKRFPKGETPQAGKTEGELTYEDLQNMTREQIAAIPVETFDRLTKG